MTEQPPTPPHESHAGAPPPRLMPPTPHMQSTAGAVEDFADDLAVDNGSGTTTAGGQQFWRVPIYPAYIAVDADHVALAMAGVASENRVSYRPDDALITHGLDAT